MARQWRNRIAPSPSRGRLTARPGTPAESGPTGLQPLGLDGARDGLCYVPASATPGRQMPLIVMLHGAGGRARSGIDPFIALADGAGVILLAPDSRAQTWDVIVADYGPDVDFINRALARTFARYAVDPARIAVEGFSDGASYALSLGVTNGDLFTHAIAFSPGFLSPGGKVGMPRCYVSHGVQDSVLPIDLCSRRIVPQLRDAGYDVQYHEFDGPHTVPPGIAREAMEWFLLPPAATVGG